MGNTFELLKSCPLFKGIAGEEVRSIMNKVTYKVTLYTKDQPVAIEDEVCTSIGIILSGGVDIQKLYASGKTVMLDSLSVGSVFGEVVVFSGMNRYPATIISNNETEIVFITKTDILKLCRTNTQFLDNFLSTLTNKILMLNRKIKNLSYQTVRQKLSNFLLEEYSKQQKTTLHLSLSRKDMADMLGIPRPSLSREMASLKDEGVIDFYKNSIKIMDMDMLEEFLLK